MVEQATFLSLKLEFENMVMSMPVIHRNGYRAEYSAENLLVEVLIFGDETNIRLL